MDYLINGVLPSAGEDCSGDNLCCCNEHVEGFIDRALAPRIKGHSFEKRLLGLALMSPVGVPGDERFCLTAAFVGDPRTGKDAIGEDAPKLVDQSNALSINAEVANKVGLIAAKVQDKTGKWRAEWGRLVEADLGFLHVRGISGLDGMALAGMREVLSTRTCEVEGAAKGKRDARCRLLVTGNPAREGRYYATRLAMVKDTHDARGYRLFRGEADLLRLHLVAGFLREDVPFETSDGAANNAVETLERRKLKALVRVAWRPAEVDPVAWESVREDLRQGLEGLREDFQEARGLAVLDREGLKVLGALALGAAHLREHWRTEGDERLVVPTREDARLAISLAREMLLKLGVEEDDAGELDAEAREVAEDLEAGPGAVLEALSDGPLTAKDVAGRVGLSRRTLFRRRYVEHCLEGRLVRLCGVAGYELTPLGAMVAKLRGGGTRGTPGTARKEGRGSGRKPSPPSSGGVPSVPNVPTNGGGCTW